MYTHLNKQTLEVTLYTTYKAISDNTDINYSTLKYQFSVKKTNKYERPDFIIQKLKPISCKRK